MDFIDSISMTRSSIRKYTGKAIPEDLLQKIVRAGMAAPSAVNVQPWEIAIVTDRGILDRLCQELPYEEMLDKAAAAIIVCGNPEKDDTYARIHWIEDCSAVSQNILLAVHELGYGAVWTTVYPHEPRLESVRRIIGIPESIIPLNVIPLGVIEGKAPAPKEKYDPYAIHFNK